MKNRTTKQTKKLPKNIQVPNDASLQGDIDFIMSQSRYKSVTAIVRDAVRSYKKRFEEQADEIKIMLA